MVVCDELGKVSLPILCHHMPIIVSDGIPSHKVVDTHPNQPLGVFELLVCSCRRFFHLICRFALFAAIQILIYKKKCLHYVRMKGVQTYKRAWPDPFIVWYHYIRFVIAASKSSDCEFESHQRVFIKVLCCL